MTNDKIKNSLVWQSLKNWVIIWLFDSSDFSTHIILQKNYQHNVDYVSLTNMKGDITVILIACVDDNYGLLFNGRRVSKDETVIKKLLEIIGNSKLWVSQYTSSLFQKEDSKSILIDNAFLEKAGESDYCFIEGVIPEDIKSKVEKLILFKWNREYPSDTKFEVDLSSYKIDQVCEFEGNSHKKITMEVYSRWRR